MYHSILSGGSNWEQLGFTRKYGRLVANYLALWVKVLGDNQELVCD